MLKKKFYGGMFFSVACLLVLNTILPIRKSYASSQEISLDNFVYENPKDTENLEVFYDKDGYLVIKITYNNINTTDDSDQLVTYSSKQKFFSTPKWKPWRTIMSVKNSTVANALSMVGTGGIGVLTSLFTGIPASVVSTVVGLKTDLGAKKAAKSMDKNRNGKWDWQTRVKSDIYGNI